MAYIHDIPARTKPRIASPWEMASLAWSKVHNAWALRRNRHEIERMLEFDATLLSDIGISRDDVVQALTTANPSGTLERVARGRRSR